MDFSFYTFDQLDAATLYEIIAHRMEVFVLGQGNIYRDLDGFDQKATHLLAREEEKRRAAAEELTGCRERLERETGRQAEQGERYEIIITESDNYDLFGKTEDYDEFTQ